MNATVFLPLWCFVFDDGARAPGKAAQPVLRQAKSFGKLSEDAELGVEPSVGRAAALLARCTVGAPAQCWIAREQGKAEADGRDGEPNGQDGNCQTPKSYLEWNSI